MEHDSGFIPPGGTGVRAQLIPPEPGDSPLDALNRNLVAKRAQNQAALNGMQAPQEAPKPVQATPPPQPARQAAPSNAPTPPATPAPAAPPTAPPVDDLDAEIAREFSIPMPGDEAPTEAPPEPEVLPVDDDLDADPAPGNENSLLTNLKKLRTSHKETRERLKTLESDFQKKEKELEQYKTGEVIPDVVQELTNRVAYLEPFERLHNLKGSKAYKEKQAPINEKKERLGEIASDYNMDPNVLLEQLGTKNEASVNRFLSEHFDPVGALEVKKLLQEVHTLETNLQSFELEPGKALEVLERESVAMNAARDQERRGKMSTTAKASWVKAHQKIVAEGKTQEIILIPGDDNHNKKIVTPLLTKASVEYGKLVRSLMDAGLPELNEEVGVMLAEMIQRAHASAVAVTTRDQTLSEMDKLKERLERITHSDRPRLGGSGGGSGPAPQASKGPRDAATLAKDLISSVLPK